MDTIIILCLIAGAILIGVSFFIKENSDIDVEEKEKIAEEIRSKALSTESLQKVMNKVEKDFEGKLSDIVEDKLVNSTDRLAEITNNKMLAINEMSGQLIEKIEQNHKEVIFLYDMLNEKSDNLKDFSAKIDGLRKELESEEKRIRALNHDLDDKILKVKEVRQTVITKSAKTAPAHNEGRQTLSTGIEQVKSGETVHNTVPTQAHSLVQMQMKEGAEIKSVSEPISSGKGSAKGAELATDKQPVTEDIVRPEQAEENSVNDKILSMKAEGKSVLEISKSLGMGQGEVQLILGLYGK